MKYTTYSSAVKEPLQELLDKMVAGDSISNTRNGDFTIHTDGLTVNNTTMTTATFHLAEGVHTFNVNAAGAANARQLLTYDYFSYDSYADVVGNDDGNTIQFRGVSTVFTGGAGDDNITWLLKAQPVTADAGYVVLSGGAGEDTLNLNFAAGKNSIIMDTEHAQGLWWQYGPGFIDDNLIDITFTGFEHINVVGSADADILVGGAGSDRLSGKNGDDVLIGGAGRDVLTGGSGRDLFVFEAGDSGVGSANRDVIMDFDPTQDHIDLRGIAGDPQVLFSVVGHDVMVRIDADHDGTYEMQVAVNLAAGHSAAEFSAAQIVM